MYAGMSEKNRRHGNGAKSYILERKMKKSIVVLFAVSLFIGSSENLKAGVNCVSGNCENGFGTYVYEDGYKYKGQWKDGKFYGSGTRYYDKSGKIYYKGQWKEYMA